MMHRTSKIGVVFAVALLVAGLAAPASAKKGGVPGPPSGTGLEVTVESGSLMWANSEGDKILFDITVTNTSGGDLRGVTVTFTDTSDPWVYTFELAKNQHWSKEYTYTVVHNDIAGLPASTRTDVKVGTVTAIVTDPPPVSEEDLVTDSDDAVMTASWVPPCDPNGVAPFTFGPNEEYSVCSFTAGPEELWTMETTLAKPAHGKSVPPGATVRDGVPGNWCMTGDLTYVKKTNTVTETVYFPAAVDDNIVCEQGGAGGDPIPVRNANTFYLATWTGNEVTLTPPPPPPPTP